MGSSNDQWRLQFPNAHVKVLTCLDFSDNHPLLVSLTINTTRSFPYYFKFESAWILEENCHDMVSFVWKANTNLANNLEVLKTQVTKWNVHTVKRVQKEKNKLMAKFKGIQKNCPGRQASRGPCYLRENSSAKFDLKRSKFGTKGQSKSNEPMETGILDFIIPKKFNEGE